MPIVRITKEFRFEGAHALIDYDGKCKHIHGHSYVLYVSVKGCPNNELSSPKCGMLMDFTELKKAVNTSIIDTYDHALLFRKGAPLAEEIKENYKNVIILPFQPTCENLIIHFAEILEENLPKNISLYSLKLYETATSYVEWFKKDNQ